MTKTRFKVSKEELYEMCDSEGFIVQWVPKLLPEFLELEGEIVGEKKYHKWELNERKEIYCIRCCEVSDSTNLSSG